MSRRVIKADNKRALQVVEPLPSSLVASESLRFDLDKSLRLADNPRPLKMKWTLTSTADNVLVNRVTEMLREHQGLNRFSYKKHRVVVSMVMANVIYAAKHSAQVLYSRRTNTKQNLSKNPDRIDNRLVMRVIDCLAANNLVQNHIGASNEYDGVKSWCQATPKLMNIVEQLRLEFGLSNKAPSIILRNSDKQEIEFSNMRKALLRQKTRRKPVDLYNRFWRQHSATISTDTIKNAPVIPFVHRVFNLSQDLELGGRFYGEHETLPQSIRKQIRIDHDETVELDYSALHINLLYAQEGLQFVGDANAIQGMNRELAKAIILRLLNSDKLGQFKANVTCSANPFTKEQWQQWLKLKQQRQWIESRVSEFRKPDFLKGFIEGIPEGLTGEQALEMICQAHAPIKHHFGTENIGLKLQFKDSEIMSNCLTECLSNSFPVMPIHDSVICKKKHANQVKRIMETAYSNANSGLKIAVKAK